MAIAFASSNFNDCGTFANVGMPRKPGPPGRIMIVSNVPIMFLNRSIVSRLVPSPTAVRMANDEMPTMTPSIIRSVRTRYRPIVRSACRMICFVFIEIRRPFSRSEPDLKLSGPRAGRFHGQRTKRPNCHESPQGWFGPLDAKLEASPLLPHRQLDQDCQLVRPRVLVPDY